MDTIKPRQRLRLLSDLVVDGQIALSEGVDLSQIEIDFDGQRKVVFRLVHEGRLVLIDPSNGRHLRWVEAFKKFTYHTAVQRWADKLLDLAHSKAFADRTDKVESDDSSKS